MKSKTEEIGHARFTRNGCGFDPTRDRELPKGTNVIYHPVFWNIPRERAEAVAREHAANLHWEPAS